MSQSPQDAFEAWDGADQLARWKEEQFREAWSRFERREGSLPSPALIADVAKARALANDKLTLAMLLIGEASTPRQAPRDVCHGMDSAIEPHGN